MTYTLAILGLGEAGAAIISLAMPALQAAATILILKYQKGQYDDVADQRIKLITKAVDTYTNTLDALIASGIFLESFGRVPDAVLYEEVNASEEQIAAINDNLKAIPEARRQVEAVNRLTENNDITRMIALDPRYLKNINLEGNQISDLLAGKLPVDDVIEIITDVAESAALLGRVGNVKGTTMRYIGISRLRAQAAGRQASERMANKLNRDVSPINRQTTMVDLLQTPAQRMALALTQNQLLQQSLQNAANADAAGDPTAYAKLQTQLQEANNRLGVEANKGNLINQFTPNYAAILQPQIQSLTETLQWGKTADVQEPNQAPTPSVSNTPAPAQLSGGPNT
tara:strand:- start:1066 stop:2091 length:1026 start_codon:yes stop_codon:yes gene_type:complete